MSAGVLYNEKELLYLIGTGDQLAFSKLFHHHRNRIYSIAYRISGSTTLSEEVVQDVFLKIWLKRAELDHIENFSAYLSTIVQNTMYKVLKRLATQYKGALEPIVAPSFSSNPEVQLIDKENHSMLQEGIDKLPRQQKQVYKLIREKGLKRTEVADMLNLHSETVKYHLSQAVKNLRSYCELHLPVFLVICLGIL